MEIKTRRTLGPQAKHAHSMKNDKLSIKQATSSTAKQNNIIQRQNSYSTEQNSIFFQPTICQCHKIQYRYAKQDHRQTHFSSSSNRFKSVLPVDNKIQFSRARTCRMCLTCLQIEGFVALEH